MIPPDFEQTPNGAQCPSCQSELIRKISHSDSFIKKNYAIAPIDNDNADDETARVISSSLQSARCANLLLQAMSFDEDTRGGNCVKKEMNPLVGVSYCNQCRAHVIVDVDELERMFDQVFHEYGSDDEAIEDYLKGGVYVVVDEAEVLALIRGRKQKELRKMKEGASFGCMETVPTRPAQFDYPYRHKVASKVMGVKIGQGYKLLEVICDDCEMPMMQLSSGGSGPECVVCPKLFKKLAKLGAQARNPIAKMKNDVNQAGDADAAAPEEEEYQVDPDDPVSFIIAEARRAIKIDLTSKTAGISRVEEAKKYLQARLGRNEFGTIDSGRTTVANQLDLLPSIESASPADESAVILTGSEVNEVVDANRIKIDWDEYLSEGRKLLEERLKNGWVISNENCQGLNCKGTPLVHIDGGPDSCTVCGGSGSGLDGAYEFCVKSQELLEAERALVSQEIDNLLSKGWVLRDRFCVQCSMPLISEHSNSVDLCILCGELPVTDGTVAQYFDENNAAEAGERILQGWTLAQAPFCNRCGGIQMVPPESKECGCINNRCPMVLAAACSEKAVENDNCAPSAAESVLHETPQEAVEQNKEAQHQNQGEYFDQVKDEDKEKSTIVGCGSLPVEVGGGTAQFPQQDDTSVLSDDVSQVRSVASSALGAILVRLDDAKYQLEALQENGHVDEEECIKKQAEIAVLIEKLASAAVAMKQMEDSED
ncbi:hypothetical protein ACHAXS_008368 [Conticribra weissflogii]